MEMRRKRYHGTGKKFARDGAGFSLIEIIITVAVLSILTASSVTFVGHIHYANTQKAANEIYSVLRSQQVNSMSGSDNQALYIYRVGGDYYMRVAAGNLPEADLPTVLTAAGGRKIANSNVTIQGVRMTDGVVTATYNVTGNSSAVGATPNCVKILYKRSGVFNYASGGTNVDAIKVVGSSEHTITLVKMTGKCVLD